MIIYDGEGRTVLNLDVDDNSYRNRAIMGDHNLTLHYSLAEHVEIPVGAYTDYQGERYTLIRPESLKMKHSRYFEYTVIMEAPEAKAKIWKFRNTVDGRLKFPFTAKPREHLRMFVENMNMRDSGWTIGECIEGPEVLISYNHAYCYDALAQMASVLKTEFEFNRKEVSLHKVEYNKNNPLALSHGRGKGFKPNVGRGNYGDNPPIEILCVQGGSDNIDRSKYGSNELLLPKNQTIKYDGKYFEDEEGFNASNARAYVVDDLGQTIKRADKELSSLAEDSYDCSEIYPKRVGTISGVVVVDEGNHFYDIIDAGIPAALNYEDFLIYGETMTIIFQSGMLSGREFEAKYYHEATDGKVARRFEIIPQEIDGETMPNSTFSPKDGDTYAVFHCMLPDAYIRDDNTKSGASWDMFRAGVKYLFDNEDTRFSFTGELDGIWAKKDWENIGGRIKLGGFVEFHNEQFQKEGVLVRITGIKDYINNPHSPEIVLSNSTVTGGYSTKMNELISEEVLVESYRREALQFTKRRFRDARETMSMLEEALIGNFNNSITPLTVQTMMMLVGDESLQFRFVNSRTNPSVVQDGITFNNKTKQLSAPAGILQHLTLGISTINSSHTANEYKFWDVGEYTSAVIDESEKKYYLYVKANRNDSSASFFLSEAARKMDAESSVYYFLVGVLNSEYDGERSFVPLYGFTEVLPGRITTDKIVSPDGVTYFDLANGEIGGNIKIKSGSAGLHNFDEWGVLNGQIEAIEKSVDDVDKSVDSLNEYVDGAFADGIITEVEARAIEKYINTVNNTKAAVEATYNKLYENPYLSGQAVKNALSVAKTTLSTAIENLLKAINTAISDGKTTVSEKNDVDSKFATFNSALSMFNNYVELANKTIQDVLKGYSDDCFAELGVLNGQIEAQVSRVDNIQNTIDTAGWITTADGNKLYASKNNIISFINQSAESITINASKINLSGVVSVSSFNSAITTFTAELNKKVNSSSLGDWAYKSGLIESAMLSETIIVGGFLNTDYIKVKSIEAEGAKIGSFVVNKGRLDWRGYGYLNSTPGTLTLGMAEESDAIVETKFNASIAKFGVSSIGTAAGGACIYASSNTSQKEPAANKTYAGYFDGDVEVNGDFISSGYYAHGVYNGATDNWKGINLYGDGYDNPDLDGIRLIVRCGLIIGYQKE